MLNILIMFNNFFHDLATAVFFVGLILVYLTVHQAMNTKDEEIVKFAVAVYEKFTPVIFISFIWVLLGGAIRALTYRQFEWVNAVGNDQIPLLIVKHILLFGLAGSGLFFWSKASRMAARQKEKLDKND